MRYLLAIAASALLVPFGIAQQTPTTTSPNGNTNSSTYSNATTRSPSTQNGQYGQSTTANPSINANQSSQPGSASPSNTMEHPAPVPENQSGQSNAIGSQAQQSGSMGTTGTATTAPQSSMSNTTGAQQSQPATTTPGAAASQSTSTQQQSGTQSGMQANNAQNEQMLQGCIVKRDTEYFLQPANGGSEVHLDASNMQPYNRVMNNEEAQVFGHYGNGNEAGAAYNSENSAKHEQGAMTANNTGQAGVSGTATQNNSATSSETTDQAGSSSAMGSQSSMSGTQSAGTQSAGAPTAQASGLQTGQSAQQGQQFQITRVVSISTQCTPAAGASTGTTPR